MLKIAAELMEKTSHILYALSAFMRDSGIAAWVASGTVKTTATQIGQAKRVARGLDTNDWVEANVPPTHPLHKQRVQIFGVIPAFSDTDERYMMVCDRHGVQFNMPESTLCLVEAPEETDG